MSDQGTFTVQCAAAVAPAKDGDGTGQMISGTIINYGQIIHPFGPWMSVRVVEGALEIPARLSEVKLLEGHSATAVIGSMSALTTEGTAVKASYRVARTQRAQDALMLAQDGHIDGLSIGFTVLDGQEVIEDGEPVFEVTRASLKETSLVAWPADSQARISEVIAQERSTMPTPPAPTPEPAAALSTEDIQAIVMAAMSNAAAPAAPEPSVSPVPDSVRPAIGMGVQAQSFTAGGIPFSVQARDREHSKYPGIWLPGDAGYVTAGDYFSSFFRATQHGEWERYATIRAALKDETTAEIPGLLPKQIVGEMLGRASGRRPGWDSLTSRDMPMAGKTFERPKISQHVKVDPQTAEKTEVASQTYKVDLDPVSKTTLAGALDISRQALDWSSPALINELMRDFVAIYVKRTDLFAMANLTAGATGGPIVWNGERDTIVKALADAAAAVYAADTNGIVDFFPNSIWMSPDVWAILAGLTDTTGRPLFPTLGVMNAPGTINISNPEQGISLPGFRVVVDKHLAAGTLIVGDREAIESYENGRQFLQAVRADVLGLDIAYMGYVATYIPWPKALVKITITPDPPEAPAAPVAPAAK